MEQPEKIELNFRKSILLMLEQSQIMHDNFVTDQAAFTAKFPALAPPFAANWQTAITTADALPSDDAIGYQIGLLSQAVEQEMLRAKNQYQSLLIYVKMAYPKDAAVLKLFGQQLYESASRNQLEMIELLELAGAQANAAPYKAALIAKGFLQSEITLIATIEAALRTKNKAQEAAILQRSLSTQTRHNALNAVWEFNITVHDAAELVFKDDFAKQQFYLLYPENSAGGGTPPAAAGISIVSDQSTISGMPLEITISGNLSANGGGILATWESGVTNSANLPAGGTINFQHMYAIPGIKNITVTEVTAGVFAFISALQIPNINATSITLGADLSSATNFNFYGNKIPLSNMNDLLTEINSYGTFGGLLNISGGTMPVPDPAFAPLIALRSRGWMVSTN